MLSSLHGPTNLTGTMSQNNCKLDCNNDLPTPQPTSFRSCLSFPVSASTLTGRVNIRYSLIGQSATANLTMSEEGFD
jgi:hypothetical protein